MSSIKRTSFSGVLVLGDLECVSPRSRFRSFSTNYCRNPACQCFFLLFEECEFFSRSKFQSMFSCSSFPFGPPQAGNFAIFALLFDFLQVLGAISEFQECELQKISHSPKNFTFSNLKNVQFFEKFHNFM